MIAAVVLASLWTQAEPAPPPPAPPAPPPPPVEQAPPPANALAVMGQLSIRLRPGGIDLVPTAGFALGGNYTRRFITLGSRLDVGAGIDFFYDRFANDTVGLNANSFAALATARWRGAKVCPFAAVGPGIVLSSLSSTNVVMEPVSTSAVQALVRAAVGLEIPTSDAVSIIARADYTLTFNRPLFVTPEGESFSVFGDFLHVGVGMLAHF